MFHKILVALDHSNANRLVFDEAIALAKSFDASLLILHILAAAEDDYPNPSLFPYTNTVDPALQQELMERHAQQWRAFERRDMHSLQWLVSEAILAGVKVDLMQQFGEPGHVICSVASSWGAETIVMGRRGHTGWKELMMGSVSNYVLHHAPCSVLVVQGQGQADDRESAPEISNAI
jgi:nucleotide-binding universal stress UspA family protein